VPFVDEWVRGVKVPGVQIPWYRTDRPIASSRSPSERKTWHEREMQADAEPSRDTKNIVFLARPGEA
jgi:hypothetical protein